MTPDQIPGLLKRVSYADPRVLPDDEREVVGMAALWADVLRDVPADYAMQAVSAHYAVSPFPIKPSDISTRWRALVRDRMDKHNGTFEPTVHPQLDPRRHSRLPARPPRRTPGSHPRAGRTQHGQGHHCRPRGC
jgi:hypothetical protein